MQKKVELTRLLVHITKLLSIKYNAGNLWYA